MPNTLPIKILFVAIKRVRDAAALSLETCGGDSDGYVHTLFSASIDIAGPKLQIDETVDSGLRMEVMSK